jgi:hypothetical protein
MGRASDKVGSLVEPIHQRLRAVKEGVFRLNADRRRNVDDVACNQHAFMLRLRASDTKHQIFASVL